MVLVAMGALYKSSRKLNRTKFHTCTCRYSWTEFFESCRRPGTETTVRPFFSKIVENLCPSHHGKSKANFVLRIMPYPLTSAYVKVFPKSILAAVFCAIILVYVLADVFAKKLQPKSIFEAFVAEFARHAKNNKSWTKMARLWPDLSKVSSSIDRARRLPTLIDVLDGDA